MTIVKRGIVMKVEAAPWWLTGLPGIVNTLQSNGSLKVEMRCPPLQSVEATPVVAENFFSPRATSFSCAASRRPEPRHWIHP